MKSAIKGKLTKVMALFMIGVIAMLIANKAVFTHVHKLADGTFIVHAHPYDKSSDPGPFKSHHHTKNELSFFQHFEIPFLIVFLTSVFIVLFIKKKVRYNYITKHSLTFTPLYKGRSPPFS